MQSDAPCSLSIFEPSLQRTMPPRKKPSAKTAPSPTAASTAAIFRDGTPPQTQKTAVETPTQTANPAASTGEKSVEDEIAGQSAVFRAIYGAQDFLNDELDFAKFVQLVMLAFICHAFYLYNPEYVKENMYRIGFNGLGVGMAFIMSYRSRLKLHKRDPVRFPLPRLPEFNLIYAVFIPTAIAALYKSDALHLNLCFNYFVVDYIHPVVRLVSAIAYFVIYREEKDTTPTAAIAVIFVFHAGIQYLLNYFNKGSDRTSVDIPEEVLQQDDTKAMAQAKESSSPIGAGTHTSLCQAEIQLFSVLLSNVVHYTALNDQYNLPLIIFQKLVISLVSTSALLYPLFVLYSNTRNFLVGILSAAVSGGLFVYLTNYQLTYILPNSSAISWLWLYITGSAERQAILSTWLAVLAVVIPLVFVLAPHISLNLRRKIWHWVILGLVTYPAYVDQPQFTIIALLGSAVVFVVLEIIRFSRFTFVGQWLSQSLLVFQDFKDLKGPLNVSYIYLIAGVSMPMVFDYCIDQRVSIKSFLGVISLGLGDSSASIIGKRFGSVKWRGGPKSVQGTVAFVLITFGGLYLVDQYILDGRVADWEPVFVSCLIGGILEGVSTLNDNLVIPCVMMIALDALQTKK